MKLRVPARPRIWLATNAPAPWTRPCMVAWRLRGGLGRDREDDAAERVRQLPEPRLEVHEAGLDLRLGRQGEGDGDDAPEQRRHDEHERRRR